MNRRLALAVVLLAGALCAQNENASLTGEVTDASAAAVPRVSLRLVNNATGEVYQTLSTDTGNFSFPLVKPGEYTLHAELTGFKQFQRGGIVLETGIPARADIRLEVGARTEQVSVVAEVPLLESETSAVGATVANTIISDMPLVDRRATQLAKLSGFNVQFGTGSSTFFTIAGGRSGDGYFTMDGGNDTNIVLGTNTIVMDPPLESVEEFNLSESNFSAELGRTGGGVIQLTTKSGTNSFHGSGYEYARNTAFATRSFFAPTVPILHYNLYGAALGGPIRKNKTFFFLNYEGIHETTQTTAILNLPTPAEVSGNFSADSYVVRDPTTAARTPYPGNIIPQSALDPIGSAAAQFYPAPNLPGRPSGNSNYSAPDTTTEPGWNIVSRVDHTISSKDRMFLRIAWEDYLTTNLPVFTAAGADPYAYSELQWYFNSTATWIHDITPTTLNEFRYTWDLHKVVLKTPGDTSGLDEKLGLAGVNPQFFGEFAPAGLTQLGGDIAFSNGQERIQSPIRDNALDEKVTLIRGSHQLKFGVEYRSSLSTEDDLLLAGGYFVFNNVATGSALAAMLLGWTDAAEVQETEPLHARASTHALFAQDDWKVTPRLTLNLGLRWDIDSPRWEQSDRQNGFNETAINPVCNCPGVVTFAGQNGLGKYAHNWDWKDFGPRFGFAYRLGDTWVLRGGGAQIYVGQYDQATPTYAALGFQATTALTSPDNGITPAVVLSRGLPPLEYPSPSQLTAGYGAVPPGASPTTAVDFFYPTGRKEGYLEQYNFNIERQIAKDMVAEIGYLATLGHHLSSPTPLTIDQVPPALMGPGNAQVNRPFPQFSNVSEDVPDIGNSSYNAMNLRLEKRWSHGLLFQTNYTWSRLIDDLAARSELGGNTTDFQNIYDRAADRGLSGNSISHRVVLSTVYALPAGAGRGFDARNRLVNGAIGGWSLGYIAVLQTGPPWGAVDLTNTTNSFSPAQRPNVVGDPNNLPSGRSKARQLAEWFNTSAFAIAAPYTFGDAGRTDGFGPGLISMDVSILREFRIRERHTLEFRMEMLNFLNHANFANPNTSVGSSAFGQVTSLITGNQSRIIQFALHYKF